jgi:hypothetical protein
MEKILYKISERERQLLRFIREKHRFGRIEIVIHSGEPRKIIIQNPPEIILEDN